MDNENLVDFKFLTDDDGDEFLYLEQAGQPVILISRDTAMVARSATLTDEVLDDPHAVQALRNAWGFEGGSYVIGYYTDRPDGEEIIVAERDTSRALVLTRTTRVSYGLRG